MRENKVLAPKENLNNNTEEGTKFTVSKSCQLVVQPEGVNSHSSGASARGSL